MAMNFQPVAKATQASTPDLIRAEIARATAEQQQHQQAQSLRSNNLQGAAQLYNAGMGERTPIADSLWGAEEAAVAGNVAPGSTAAVAGADATAAAAAEAATAEAAAAGLGAQGAAGAEAAAALAAETAAAGGAAAGAGATATGLAAIPGWGWALAAPFALRALMG